MDFAAVMVLGGIILGAFSVALMHKEPRVKRVGVWRTRRVMRATAVSPIASLDDGKLACIVGRVELDGDGLISVMSRRTCVAHEIVEFRRGVRRAIVPFFVVDETGRVRVDAGEAALLQAPVKRGETFEERIIEPGDVVRVVGSVRKDPAAHDTDEHHFREGASAATLTGTAKWPLIIDLEP